LAVKAQAEFQAKHRLEETKKKREAKRKRDEEVDTALLDDFDLQPPPCKEIKVVSKTALIRGKTKCQASIEDNKSKEDELIFDTAEALLYLNFKNAAIDGTCVNSDAMSSSHESEELNNAKQFDESSVGSDATSADGSASTSWGSRDNIASAVTKKQASKSVKPQLFAVRNREALAAKKKKKCKTTSDSDDEEYNPSEENKPKIYMTRILPLVEAAETIWMTIWMTSLFPPQMKQRSIMMRILPVVEAARRMAVILIILWQTLTTKLISATWKTQLPKMRIVQWLTLN